MEMIFADQWLVGEQEEYSVGDVFHGRDALDDRTGDATLILAVYYEESAEWAACRENITPFVAENKDAFVAANGFGDAHCMARKRFASV